MADKVVPTCISLGSIVLLAALAVDFAVVIYNALNAH